MKLRYLFLAVILCTSPVFCADDPFVFSDDGLLPLDYAYITEYGDSDVIDFTTSSSLGDTIDTTKIKRVSEIKEEINERIDIKNPITRRKGVVLAGKYPGDHTIDQISSIYNYLKEGWHYTGDPRSEDYYAYASESLEIGEELGCAGAGDCDDFAILMSALIESVGGTTRIVLAYNGSTGHAYAEVYLGQLDASDHHVDQIVAWLKSKYDTNRIYTHIDSNTKDVWLNLDWSANHPGGPFYKAEKQVVIAVSDEKRKVPLNFIIEMFQKTFGGSDYDYGSSVQQTTDGGFILI